MSVGEGLVVLGVALVVRRIESSSGVLSRRSGCEGSFTRKGRPFLFGGAHAHAANGIYQVYLVGGARARVRG